MFSEPDTGNQMLIRILRTKAPGLQSLLFLVFFFIPLPYLVTKGIEIQVPEDSSTLYLWFASLIVHTHVGVKISIYFAFILWILFQLSELWRMSGTLNQPRMVALITGVLVFHLFPQNNSIHPLLPALSFLIPGITYFLKASLSGKPEVLLFNAGFLISVGTLFCYSFLLFFPILFTIILVMRLYRLNYFGVILAGVFLPWVYYLVILWVFEISPDPGFYACISIFLSNFLYFFTYLRSSFTFADYMLLCAVIIPFFAALLYSVRVIDQKIIAVRQLQKSLYWLLIPVNLMLLISGGMFHSYFLATSITGVPLLTDYLLRYPKARTANFILIFLMVCILVFQIRSVFL
jgi:hypothetical protein